MGVTKRGGLYKGGYKIIVDIKKTLVKNLVYFNRNFFMNIKLIITKSMNFCSNSITHQRQPQMAKINKSRRPMRGFTVAVGAYSRGGELIDNF